MTTTAIPSAHLLMRLIMFYPFSFLVSANYDV
jgi:hypothetical protein